jgi:hypothetical protein
VPDDSDYQWLGRLIADPKRWSKDELSAMQSMIADQKLALAALHAEDAKTRRSYSELIEQMEGAVRAHITSR